MLAAVSANPGFSGCGRSRHSRRATDPAAPDLVRRLAAARKYRWRTTMPERSPMRSALRQESPRRVYRNGGDGDHKML